MKRDLRYPLKADPFHVSLINFLLDNLHWIGAILLMVILWVLAGHYGSANNDPGWSYPAWF